MAKGSSLSRGTSGPAMADGSTQIGYSLQDTVRLDIWFAYKKASAHKKKLITEKVRNGGFVKVKSALEALNDMYDFVDDADVYTKNELYYHDKLLKEIRYFTSYFQDQLKILEQAKAQRQELIHVGETGFSIYHFRRWLRLCRYFVEKSGIAKFERPQETSSELAFSRM